MLFEHDDADAQQLRDELRAAGMPSHIPVRVTRGHVEVDWPDAGPVVQAHRPDPRHRWPDWKVELDDLLGAAQTRTLTTAESKKVDAHLRQLAHHSLTREKNRSSR